MKQRTNIMAMAMLAMLSTGQASAAQPATDATVSRADFKGQWPFTVDAGRVGCERGQFVKFVVGKVTYSLNGSARTYSQKMGFGWHDVREIWRVDPPNPGAKISVSDMIAKGQALCRAWP